MSLAELTRRYLRGELAFDEYRDLERALSGTGNGESLRRVAREQAVADALDLVRRIAERPETLLLLRSWTLDRCALCDALVPWDGHTEHKPSCPWLEARRIVALLNDSDGPGASES